MVTTPQDKHGQRSRHESDDALKKHPTRDNDKIFLILEEDLPKRDKSTDEEDQRRELEEPVRSTTSGSDP